MVAQLPRFPSRHETAIDTACIDLREENLCLPRKWYFSKQEIEFCSPSRNDDIDHDEESHLRKLYCSFLQNLGMELEVPQVTIATAMMLCHRFYMHQSHTKNDWQTIATASMFLACKSEETPKYLNNLLVVAYKLMYKWDPSAPRRIRQKEVYDKRRELIITGERVLLATIGFDLNIEHPYKPLVAAFKSLDISDKELVKIAWNFVNDWMRSTLCLQYKPHYIAAGSIFLAAKLQKVKLPKVKGKVWWMQFDVSPLQLEEVIREMMAMLDQGQTQASQPIQVRTKTEPKTEPKAFIVKEPANTSDCGSSAESVVEDCEGGPIEESNQISSCKIISVNCGNNYKIDVDRIRGALKRRRLDRITNAKAVESTDDDDDLDCEAWIQKELENGLQVSA